VTENRREIISLRSNPLTQPHISAYQMGLLILRVASPVKGRCHRNVQKS
jgi:hypothetical protein